jgi:hypothetical protein
MIVLVATAPEFCSVAKKSLVILRPNQFVGDNKCCAAADNFKYKLSRGKNCVGARYSRSLEPPGHQDIVDDTTLIL